MAKIDATKIEEEVRNELNDEAKERAKEKLKELYKTREKAALALKNLDRQITSYLNEIEDLATYEAAGVNTIK